MKDERVRAIVHVLGWKCRKAKFPRLNSLAKKYLSVPAISALSERVSVWEGGHYNMPQGMP